MGYSIIDILDKGISIVDKREEVYLALCNNNKEIDKLELIIRMLIKSIKREKKYYIRLKEELNDKVIKDIDFLIYDKISFLINEFNNKIKCENVEDIHDVLRCSLSIDKDIFALFINIQGRLIKSNKDLERTAYEVFTNIIKEKEKNIKQLEKYVK